MERQQLQQQQIFVDSLLAVGIQRREEVENSLVTTTASILANKNSTSTGSINTMTATSSSSSTTTTNMNNNINNGGSLTTNGNTTIFDPLLNPSTNTNLESLRSVSFTYIYIYKQTDKYIDRYRYFVISSILSHLKEMEKEKV